MKRILIPALLLAALLAGCTGQTPPASSKDEPVTLVLDYVPNTNHTGFYVAQEKGYFAKEGLDVTIIEPADGAVTTLIAAGQGTFGISYQEDVTYALTAEAPLPIRAIATIIQHNTSGFASYEEKGITRPADFEGKIYAGWGSPSEEAVLKAVMTADGGDFDKLTVVTGDGSGYAALKDRVDVMWFFWAWDGIASQLAGVPVNYIELREFDPRLDYYTPVIIASNNTLQNQPELTKKFLRATARGYQFCIENPQEAAAILQNHVTQYDLDMLTQSQEYLAEKYMEDTDRWGVMKDAVWADYTAFMVENGLIQKVIAPEDCYTNEFLPE
jgi:ABC-type nitrate/sulfonate/bicarbonate transport system substrate-binding protein